MLHIDATFEDTRLIITRDVSAIGTWEGTISDGPSGSVQDVENWTDSQVSAVLALASGIGEEAPESEMTKQLYVVAEPLFKDMDTGVPTHPVINHPLF